MEEKRKQNEEGNTEQVKELDKQIRKNLKDEKQQYKLAQFIEIDELGYKWDGIKSLKKKFTPKFCKFKDKQGKHIPVKEYANKAAEYLQDVQWKTVDPAVNNGSPKMPFGETFGKVKDEKIHIKEMDFIIDKMKIRKLLDQTNFVLS